MVHIVIKKQSKRYPQIFIERRLSSFDYAGPDFEKEFERLASKGKMLYAWGETPMGPQIIAETKGN